MVNVTFSSFPSADFCSTVSSPLCLLNFSPAFTSPLPPLPLHLLIPQANSAPKDVTCHIMSAKSLCHLHRTDKQDSFPPPLRIKKKEKKIQHNFKWHITEKRGWYNLIPSRSWYLDPSCTLMQKRQSSSTLEKKWFAFNLQKKRRCYYLSQYNLTPICQQPTGCF